MASEKLSFKCLTYGEAAHTPCSGTTDDGTDSTCACWCHVESLASPEAQRELAQVAYDLTSDRYAAALKRCEDVRRITAWMIEAAEAEFKAANEALKEFQSAPGIPKPGLR